MRPLALLLAAAAISAAPASALALDANKYDGTWKGIYTCGQGPTTLVLTLDGDANGKITGLFAFSRTPDNPDVPTGSFRVAGSLGSDGMFTLQGVQWVQQPAGYGMVGLHGKGYLNPNKENGPPVLFGEVTGLQGCTEFALERQ